MIPPTPEQARALDAIRKLTKGGVPPTYRDLGDALGMAVSAVHRLLTGLKERGHVDFKPRQRRSLRIIGELPGLETRSTDELLRLRAAIDLILKGRSS